MTTHRVPRGPRGTGWPAACSAVAIASLVTIWASAGPPRLIAGLSLLAALACATGLGRRAPSRAVVPALGLTLAFLVLAGLALAALHSLSAVPAALAAVAATLAAAWAGVRGPDGGYTRRHGAPGILALAGVLAFAVTAALAVRYAATSATADSRAASSLALWAYPAGGRLHVGARQPAGHGAMSLRVVVTLAGTTVAAWGNVRLVPGQEWEAPALALTGNGPVRVIALRGGAVVASLSSSARQ